MTSSVDAKSMEGQQYPQYLEKDELLEKSSFILYQRVPDSHFKPQNDSIFTLVKSVDQKVLQCYASNAYL